MNIKEHKSDGNASKIDQITAILNGPQLEKAWKECLSAWEDSSPAQRADCRAFAVNLRDQFVRILRDVSDPDEQETVVSLFYTQVKAQWILINTQSGYQIQNGRVEGALFCRAGMLSALLGALEPVLRKSDLTRITNFLAEPEGSAGSNDLDAAALSSLLGTEVVFAPESEEDVSSPRIVVDARTIENRFREMAAQVEDGERQWKELQADLGVNDRNEIVPLFEKIHSRALPSEEGNPDVALSRAAQAEWAERRELQLRAFRDEVAALRADWEQIRIETGTTDVPSLIASWRNTRDTLRTVRSELAKERAELSSIRAEYGEDASVKEILTRVRELSTRLAEVQANWEKLHTETEYLGREFGVFDATRIVELVRNLRDKLTEQEKKSAQARAGSETLEQEFGTGDVNVIVGRVREMRDSLAAATREMIPLRADRYVLQNELSKTDAREIVAHIRALEARIESYSEMSELLGSMEQALKTLE